MNTEIELQLHEAYIDGAYVYVSYSEVGDNSLHHHNIQLSKKKLLAFMREKKMNYIETLDVWLTDATFLEDEINKVVIAYLEDNM